MKKIVIILVIFLSVALANYWGFSTSLKRQRDTQRILDIGEIETGLHRYYSEYGFYPLSTENGQILACPGEKTGVAKNEAGFMDIKTGFKKPKLLNLVACRWGIDSLWDASDVNYPAYIDGLPADPLTDNGFNYVYISDGRSFRILGSLELKEYEDYSKEIVVEKISCGKRLCNFGRSGIVK